MAHIRRFCASTWGLFGQYTDAEVFKITWSELTSKSLRIIVKSLERPFADVRVSPPHSYKVSWFDKSRAEIASECAHFTGWLARHFLVSWFVAFWDTRVPLPCKTSKKHLEDAACGNKSSFWHIIGKWKKINCCDIAISCSFILCYGIFTAHTTTASKNNTSDLATCCLYRSAIRTTQCFSATSHWASPARSVFVLERERLEGQCYGANWPSSTFAISPLTPVFSVFCGVSKLQATGSVK